MLCKNCGAQLPDGTERCEFCGADLTGEHEQDTMVFNTQEIETAEEAEEEEEVLDENELNRRAQMEKMMAEKQQQLSEIEKRRNIKKKRQRQTKIAIICAICAACVAVVGFGSYAVKESLSNKAEPSPSPSPTAAPTMAVPTPLTTSPVPLGSPAPGATMPSSVIGGNSSNSAANGTNGSSSNGNGSSSASRPSGNSSSASGSNTGSSGGVASRPSSSGSGSQSGAGSSVNSSSSATSVAKPSGISTATVDAKLTTGGEVLYNNDTGRYLMTFATGNTLYYANVSEGSTTEQIKNKNITITAHPTQETYKGNTIYEITGMTYYDDSDYIIPQSGTRLLSKDEVKNMSKEQLALARNEIYARHGRKFQMAQFRDYFTKKSWYKENPGYNYDNEGSNLNEIEAKNVNLLLSVENSK